ncbi:ROK family protein [Methylobacterium sp. J-068]|uniref:ROK family protein n=1 Tax=Methylobacterium sp. J-068 TaxID=2836649 RepID=UPI001FBB39A2|nr:ROK family protein [Methylobacterium sp. J-068]MCJ2036687.1 ROK family protein [Methylobacterium sp. J-068]
MARETQIREAGIAHAAQRLPSVVIDDYNIELKDGDGFIGDRVSKTAFRAMLETCRERLRPLGPDPLGDRDSCDFSKRRLDQILLADDPIASGVVWSAIEAFAQELARVVRIFLSQDGWQGTQAIVVGGGFRDSRAGCLAIGRAGFLLRAEGIDITLTPIRHHPDEGGLIGAVHLAPAWIFSGYDSLLAVDIGGSNIRAGVVTTNLRKAPDLSRSAVWRSEIWRHRDEEPMPSREEAVDRLIGMLNDLIRRADRADLTLAPFIGIGCPGVMAADGTISRGGQNLPGNWEGRDFNLAERLVEAIPRIGEHATMVVMHNDAVVQGLSEVPDRKDVERWGVLTIGTGLGNARFTNRNTEADED